VCLAAPHPQGRDPLALGGDIRNGCLDPFYTSLHYAQVIFRRRFSGRRSERRVMSEE
jgi:hypothetical protein